MRTWRLAAVAAAGFGVGLVPPWVDAEDQPPPVPPEIVARYTEMLKKVMVAQRPRLDARMSDEIAEVARVTGLSPDGVKALEAAKGKAEDAAQAELTAKGLETLPKLYAQAGAQGFEQMEKAGNLETAAGSDLGSELRSAFGVRATAARDQPAWTEALARTLSPEQAVAWEKSRAEHQAAAAKEIGNFLAAQADQYRESLARPMSGQANEIIGWLHLPKERAAAITTAAKGAVDASLDAWRKGAEQSLLAEDDAKLKTILKRRWYGFSFDEKDAPAKQAVWTDALAKGLTDDERARLKAVRDEHRTRRVDALAQLLVATLDEKIAFTAGQRARLGPVAQRLVQADAALAAAGTEDNGNNLSTRNFHNAAAAARPEELNPILDETQRQHWQEIAHLKYTTNTSGYEVPAEANPDPPTDAKVGEEPEDLERTLSDYLRTRAAAHQREGDAALTLQAEDAARVAALAEPAARRLRIAAHGAAQADMIAWMTSTEQTVRAQVQGTTPENFPQRLAEADRSNYQRTDPKGGPLWTAAVGAEMTDAQQAAWKAEGQERARYGDAAVARFLVAEFDRRFALSAEQWNQFLPALTQAIQDYEPDIGQYFSYNAGSRWYLTSYSMFLPVNAVPENDLKALLSHEQWDAWTGSNEYSNCVNYWPGIKSNHTRRTQKKTKP